MVGEFTLIQKYFGGKSTSAGNGEGVIVGIGDDAALLQPASDTQLVTATDTLVAGVHFPHDAPADLIARRALRVNLSDMAAMGATPRWFTLALTLPSAEEQWLAEFSKGLSEDARRFACHLVGGDTTRGPLTITLSLLGEVSRGQALLRSGAKAGDLLYVSGQLGLAAAALKFLNIAESELQDWQKSLLDHYYLPEPQIRLGLVLAEFASSTIDISDGLLADVGHIAQQSRVKIQVDAHKLPTLPTLHQYFPADVVQSWLLTGGDDYQLCFTVPENRVAMLEKRLSGLPFNVTAIGKVLENSENGEVVCLDATGNRVTLPTGGYQHF